MIKSKKDYKYYLHRDALALRIVNRKYPKPFSDHIWKFQRLLRKCEYYNSISRKKKILCMFSIAYNKLKLRNLSLKLGFSIPCNVFEEGLSIAHYGSIVINPNTRIGKNCRVHSGVNIGTTNGSDKAPVIGDNVYIGPGAKIIGDITIANDVAIGANAVVVKSIATPGTTWGGVPAKQISSNNSHMNLSPYLFSVE